VITPRRTRLVRVADLHAFRDVLTVLSLGDLESVRARIVVVPASGAARQLQRTLETRTFGPPSTDGAARRAVLFPDLATREQLYDRLHARLPSAPRRLTPFEREVLIALAAEDAIAAGAAPPFRLRAGLVAEVLRFYDQLCRQGQSLTRFEEILDESLARDAGFDRGADRMLRQTRFLAATFRAYQQRVAANAACDEHGLREGHRATHFKRTCKKAGVKGVTLHSYRYAWAERAKQAGYPERFAMQALGHNSAAVHRAYAKAVQVTIPPLEDYEAPKNR